MQQTITIDPTFCGPPTTANGGYTCGLLAARLNGAVEVTLHRPPPLLKELTLHGNEAGAELSDGNELVASARPAALDLETPPAVTPVQAKEASTHYLGFSGHPFPTCFVCGPERGTEDGLQLYAGRVGETDTFAAPWTPDASLANEVGEVRQPFVWAALDCPGAFAIMGDRQRKIVLGRMTAHLERPINAGEPHVVMGWPLGSDGRKHYCGTAVYNRDGKCCALAKATWIDIE